MKKYFLFSLLLWAGQLFSQSKLGIATYTVPAGWTSTSQKGSTVVLENTSSKGSICRITIYGTEKVAVNTGSDYIVQRTNKNGMNARYSPNAKELVKTETNGNTGFSSGGSAMVKEKQVAVHFYSFTNGSETFFIELSTNSNECIEAFNQFLTSLLIDPVGTPTGNNLRAKRKAAPAAPAAPAPMM